MESIPDNRNSRIEWYVEERPPKLHEQRVLEMIERDWGEFEGRLLDIGCASGAFLAQARERFPRAELRGIELSEKLVEIGRRRWADREVHLEQADAIAYDPPAPFDVLTAQGVLSIFQDPLATLDRWLRWLAPGGRLYVFGRFNSNPMDVRITHRNRLDDQGWETGYTNYSTLTVSEHLAARGFTADFERFELPFPIERRPQPNRSYTLDLADGGRCLVNGANLIVEQFFLTAVRSGD